MSVEHTTLSVLPNKNKNTPGVRYIDIEKLEGKHEHY